ncbi:MAG: HEAT repeat domain-containing protein [Kofleriaceae bacterium]
MRWLLLGATLCALPAQGANPTLPDAVVGVLGPVDSVPSRAALDEVFAPSLAIDRLVVIASDDSHDLGIQLRAIRALPTYCPPAAGTCGPGTQSHDTLVMLIQRASAAPATPAGILRLRAAAEALGATRSGLPEDVDVLLLLLGDPDKKLDGHPSLDVRAAAARAIGQLCNRDASNALFPHLLDPAPQVVAQVTIALQNLELCGK